MIRNHFRLKPQEGLIGFEIELETERSAHLDELLGSPDIRNRAAWKGVRDGSLRNYSIELVFPKPVSRDTAVSRITKLASVINDNNLDFTDSGRGGVHVHINMQELTMTQTFNMICLYLIFEEVLIKMCGDWRVGNLFCLQAKDAEGMIHELRAIVANHDWRDLSADALRYAALNVNSLPRYGSLEFRGMRSTTDPEVLSAWIDAIVALREAALTYNTPDEIIMDYSVIGPEALYDKVFAGMPIEFDPQAMLEGMLLAQMIAFATDWTTVEEPPAYDYQALLHSGREVLQEARLLGLNGTVGYTRIENLLSLLTDPEHRARLSPQDVNTIDRNIQEYRIVLFERAEELAEREAPDDEEPFGAEEDDF